MGEELEQLLELFVSACREVFGDEKIECIVFHGSALKGGSIPGFSDIDFMVFLTPESFDDRGDLPDESAFAMQERIGPLPWQQAGFLDAQAYFYDARRLPPWWTGPIPGAHRVLLGELPVGVTPTGERLRASSLRFLEEELPKRITQSVRNFADADDATLPRRIRLLCTNVTPALFAMQSSEVEEVLELWALPKDAALRLLEARYPNADGPALARRFYEDVRRLYSGEFDAELGRMTFRTGVAFLRWAEEAARRQPSG